MPYATLVSLDGFLPELGGEGFPDLASWPFTLPLRINEPHDLVRTHTGIMRRG